MLSACAVSSLDENSTLSTDSTATTTTSSTAATTTTTAYVPTVGYCVADPSMHVRRGPGPYEEVIGGLAWGEQVSIVGKEGDWYCIVFKDAYAYVSAHYIRDTLPASTTTQGDTTDTTAS